VAAFHCGDIRGGREISAEEYIAQFEYVDGCPSILGIISGYISDSI